MRKFEIKKVSLLTLLLCVFTFTYAQSERIEVEVEYDDGYNFYVISDLGRNGYYRQKNVAEAMVRTVEVAEPEFFVSAGDTHHWSGVESVYDPLWMTNFELIYDHPHFMVEWYPILGNHEYRGNTQAMIDYTRISRRWVMLDRYYTKLIQPDPDEIDEFDTAELFFIDTTPLISDYYEDGNKYADVFKQDSTAQLQWLEEQLANSTVKFKIVIGHHPIYVSEKKRVDEQDLIEKLDPLLRKYGVDLYIAGHSHTFQHLTKPGIKVNYVVNSSASLGRVPVKGPDTRFCSPDEGFSVISIGKGRMKMTFVNYLGDPIYQFEIVK